MPRRRKVRSVQSARKPAVISSDSDTNDLEIEVRKTKVRVLLNDFKLEVDRRIEQMENTTKTMVNNIERSLNMQLLAVPPNVRNMKITDYLSQYGSSTQDNEIDKIEESIGTTLSTLSSLESITEENGNTIQKHKGRTTRAKQIMPPPSTTQTRRKQQPTPAQNKKQMLNGWDTPMMTPKFNPNLPFTPATALRKTIKGERVGFFAFATGTGSPVELPANSLFCVTADGPVALSETDQNDEMRKMVEKIKRSIMKC